ncbi:hypothetical protein PFTANZ_03160, partial [Plasmodium falciparum Tanzania (2000708)]
MGSSASKFSKTVVGKETHKSARNVLEKIVLETKGDINGKANQYKDKLKGNLKEAEFYNQLFIRFDVKKDVPSNPCELEYIFHTNVQSANSVDRDPCLFSRAKRFSNEGEAECRISRITGNKGGCGACAPYRRRHICDYNLQHINKNNINNTHDLLGNVLVMAKREGESIVKNHPNRGSSEVCIALARSFADIGDIIRGRDMFLGNNENDIREKQKLQENLVNIFKKFKDRYVELENVPIDNIREYWWALNREDVWKALTCSADGSEEYFKKPSSHKYSFSNGQCGHRDENVPTYLDYVPQYLRWFNEWAEDFCRIKNIKIGKVKNACRGEKDEKDCSREGYDCKKTNIKRNEIFVDLDCPRCEEECTSYNEWLKKKEGEFNKQNNKYKKEIENDQSNNDRIYEKQFYTNLKLKYPSVSNFVETLKEGAYCTNGIIEGKIYFNKQYDTFSHSQYCKSCPILGAECKNGRCKSLDDINCRNIPTMTNIRKQENENPINIHILVNDSNKRELSNDLKNDFKECDIFKKLGQQKWNCKYKCNLDVCELQNFHKGIDDERFVSIDVLIKRWLKYFLNDYNKIKENLNQCINNGTNTLCIKDCYKNCVCVGKWIKKKEEEWQNIKSRYVQQYNNNDKDVSSKLKKFLKQDMFIKYIKNALDPGETLDTMKETSVCNVPNKSNGTSCENEKGKQPDFEDDEEEEEEEEEPPAAKEAETAEGTGQEVKPAPPAAPKNEEACKIVKVIFNGKSATDDIEGCKLKKNYEPWNCHKSKIKSGEEGACMPPRRQKLCVINLKTFEPKTTVDLREAFIKCAAIETHFLWKYYKTKNPKEHDDLKKGTIPEKFKRQMFYTFGDYRDLCLDKNIGNDVSVVENNIKGVLTDSTKNGGTPLTAEQRKNWCDEIKNDVWDGMLCALSYNTNEKQFKDEVLEKLMKPENKNTYSTVKFSGNNSTTLEEFAQRPQFLRWFTEWSDEFCREREEKENLVQSDCREAQNYDGCDEKNKSGSCANACNEYKKYITGKKTQYESQEGKFNREKTQTKPGYENYSNKNASQYLKENCLFGSCSCMYKVKEIPDYWEKPHTTYEETSLQKKCSCPPPPCEIVDGILGNKSSMGYREGCRHKYTTRYAGWECNNSVEKGNQGACIPPRRRKLYVYDLKTLSGEVTQVQLREAFIETAAVETFFAWHEFKKEKEKEKKERDGGLFLVDSQENPQKKLSSGTIPDEFKRQMFYTFGDYRDICLGNDTGSDVKDVQTNINKVITNIGSTNGEERKNFWNKYAHDIWDAMVCALSYNTETKIKDEELHKKLINPNNKIKNENVTFSTNKITTFSEFAKKPQYKRWFEEWSEEFCRKKKIKLENIKKDCRVENGKKKCSGEGYSCDLKEQTYSNIFKNLLYPSCEEDCTNYKKWIHTKKKEFDKHKEKYQMEYNDDKRRVDRGNGYYNITLYDELIEEYKGDNSFLNFLNKEPICKNIDEYIELDHNNPEKTFLHSDYCKSCPILENLCFDKKCESTNVNNCKETRFLEGTELRTEPPIFIDIHVNDNRKKHISYDIKSDCKKCDLFKNLGKQQWECKYKCNLDVCELKTIDNGIDDEEHISIEVLIKRWLEYFLKDYNTIKKNLNTCINNEKINLCIKDCYKNCECVKNWIDIKTKEWKQIKKRYLKQYKDEDADVSYNLKVFLQQGLFNNYINNALEKGETLHTLKELDECIQPNTSNGKPCEKENVIT